MKHKRIFIRLQIRSQNSKQRDVVKEGDSYIKQAVLQELWICHELCALETGMDISLNDLTQKIFKK